LDVALIAKKDDKILGGNRLAKIIRNSDRPHVPVIAISEQKKSCTKDAKN
jgi:hypothetical protein